MCALGVFDSGIGGLTVARELVRAYPHVDLVYLGDTARLPYGAKSPDTVTKYALRCVARLVEEGISTVVVACNTASACAIPALRQRWPDLTVLGVIEPGAESALAATRTGVVGVIGTVGTITSDSYPRAITSRSPDCVVHSLATPMLVPLAEEGWVHHPVTELTLKTYLKPLLDSAPELDTLVLGCTHYPVLKAAIQNALAGRKVALVDSAEAVTVALRDRLTAAQGSGARRFLVTDVPSRFHQVASTFWPEPIRVDLVDVTGA